MKKLVELLKHVILILSLGHIGNIKDLEISQRLVLPLKDYLKKMELYKKLNWKPWSEHMLLLLKEYRNRCNLTENQVILCLSILILKECQPQLKSIFMNNSSILRDIKLVDNLIKEKNCFISNKHKKIIYQCKMTLLLIKMKY